MSSLPLDADQTISSTISALSLRLSRLEYLLTGSSASTSDPTNPLLKPPVHDANILSRLSRLQRQLQKLASSDPIIHDLLQLQSQHPQLFHPSDSASASSTSLPPAEVAAIVQAHAPLYHTTASSLQLLRDTPVPATSPLTNLIALVPRLEKLEELQRRQDAEVAELRARSARVVENWYEWGVLGMGECWGEWEGRLERAEGRCRKEEKRRKEEEESRIFGDVDGEEKGGFLKETGDGGG